MVHLHYHPATIHCSHRHFLSSLLSLLPTNPLFLCPNPFHILLIPQTRKSLRSPSCFGLLELIKITINNHKLGLPYNNTYASTQTRSITDRNQLIERSPDLNNGQQFFNGLRVSVVMERCHSNAGIEWRQSWLKLRQDRSDESRFVWPTQLQLSENGDGPLEQFSCLEKGFSIS